MASAPSSSTNPFGPDRSILENATELHIVLTAPCTGFLRRKSVMYEEKPGVLKYRLVTTERCSTGNWSMVAERINKLPNLSIFTLGGTDCPLSLLMTITLNIGSHPKVKTVDFSCLEKKSGLGPYIKDMLITTKSISNLYLMEPVTTQAVVVPYSLDPLRPEDITQIAKGILQNSSLRVLNLNGTPLKQTAVILFSCLGEKSLTTLNINNSSVEFSSPSCSHWNGLTINQSISVFTLSNSGIKGEIAVSLFTILATHPCINTLDLSNNPISVESPETNFLVFTALGSMLETSTTLQKLNLNKTNIAQGIKIFSPKFHNNTTLQFLDLSQIGIISGKQTAQVYSDLMHVPNLIKLSFNNATTTDAAAESMNKFLLRNTSLQELRIRGCSINDTGLERLSELLTRDISLHFLDLSASSFTEVGLGKLCSALANNTSLTSLKLISNNINENGMNQLTTLMKTNQTIKHLLFNNHSEVKQDFQKFFEEISPYNGSLLCIDAFSGAELSEKLKRFKMRNEYLTTVRATSLYNLLLHHALEPLPESVF